MNRIVILSTICGILLLITAACGPTATFDIPQPTGLKNEQHFNKSFVSSYLSTDSSSTLIITDKLITQHYNYTIETIIDSLEKVYHLSGDTLINIKNDNRKIVLRTDSSIIQTHHEIDTIFEFKEGRVLKKYKGQYFLNIQDNENKKWTVSKLSLENNMLTLSAIVGKEAIDMLNEITNTPEDTSYSTPNYTIDKKQFKKFLSSGGFSKIDTFLRIKN